MSYYNGRQYTFTWESGRRLASVIVDGTELSFTYNDEGIRTSKTVGTVEHVYHLNGAQIVFEESDAAVLVYLYDAEGSPIGMQYRREIDNVGVFEEYWFEKNLQGDIVAVYDGEGTKLISYTYDAWGNFTTTYHNGCTESSAANLNPFRYRGYYYDADTGLYYLQSRYYDPVVGRFLNADIYISTGQGLLGCNMFAYCGNGPINQWDPCGEHPQNTIASDRIVVYENIRSGLNSTPWSKDGFTKNLNASNDKHKKTLISAIYDNLEIHIGFGQGIGGQLDAFGMGVDVGAYGNLISWRLKNGVWACGQDYFFGITTSFIYDIGVASSEFREYEREWPGPETWVLYNPNQDSISIFSACGYVIFLGASIDVRIDPIGLCKDIFG